MKHTKLAAIMMAVLALVAGCQHVERDRNAARPPAAPGGFYGSFDYPGTNVVLGWNPAPGPVAGYQIQHGIWNTNTGQYDYTGFTLNSNATFFVEADAVSHPVESLDVYLLAAEFSDGSMSATDTWDAAWYDDLSSGPPFGPPMARDINAALDSTGTNVVITWQPAEGPATNYIVVRAAYDPTNTDGYDFSLIGTVDGSTNCFTAAGTIKSADDFNDLYEVAAIYPGDAMSAFVASIVHANPPPRKGPDKVNHGHGRDILCGASAQAAIFHLGGDTVTEH